MAVRHPNDNPSPAEVLRVPGFALFWSSSTLSAFTAAITAVALQVLIVTTLDASAFQIGLLNAVQVVPYVFLGLLVGAWMDRWRRKPALVLANAGRAIVLVLIPVLWITSSLTVWSLGAVLLVFGVLTLFYDSAAQPILPRIVPRQSLVLANARLGQAGTVAQTAGPAIGGAIVGLLGAPIAILVDAISYAASAIMLAFIRVEEPKAAPRTKGRHVGHDILDGLRWTYSHRTIAPLALSVHVWFLANSLSLTAFAPFVLRELEIGPFAFGGILAMAGVGGFLGALLAPVAGRRLGAGRAVLIGRLFAPVAWAAIALAPVFSKESLATVVALAFGQFVFGFSMGLEDANDMGYRQGVTPDEMQGRMNASIRTVNRVTLLVGAVVAGVLATLVGFQVTIWISAGVFLIAALVIAFSPLRTARHEDARELA